MGDNKNDEPSSNKVENNKFNAGNQGVDFINNKEMTNVIDNNDNNDTGDVKAMFHAETDAKEFKQLTSTDTKAHNIEEYENNTTLPKHKSIDSKVNNNVKDIDVKTDASNSIQNSTSNRTKDTTKDTLKAVSNDTQARSTSCGIEIDSVVQQLGQAGKFHVIVYVLVALSAIQVGTLHTTYIFLAGDVPYRCVIPECEAVNSTDYSPTWLEAAIPSAGREHRCQRRMVMDDTLPCDKATFSDELHDCDQWLYASHDTIVAEFNLACQEWKRTIVGTIHNIGMLVSLPILGYISDRWGRKLALILSCTLVGVIGTLKAFSVSYEMYITIEFLETIWGASAFPAAYILTIELLGQDKRVLTTAFLGIMLVIGGISFALLAKAFHYWRTFILVVYPPSILFLLYIFILPESIRWLLTKGRKEEAVEIIMKAAKMNNVELSNETMKQLTSQTKTLEEKKAEKQEEEGLWIQVLHSPIIMKRLAICSWWWITCTFVFYGLAINSVSLAGDKYTNYILVVSVEVVAVVTNALVLDRVGRKRTLLVAFTICGFACVAITFVPKNMSWLATFLYLLGKIAITQAFSGIYMYTSELFPTHARHSLLGFCSMVGRIGSIIAPQMPLLAIYVDWLPSALFGATAMVAAALMMTTPETLNTRLPDTIREAEQLASKPKNKVNNDTCTSKF